MTVAFFVDQIFWRDEQGISSDEAYTLFPMSLQQHFDEVVLLGRLAPEVGRRPYALPDSGVRLCPLPYYSSVFASWREGGALRRAIDDLVEREAPQWDLLFVCGPNPVGQMIAEAVIRQGKPVVLLVRQNLIQQIYHGNRGLRRWIGVAVAGWLEWRFRRLARGRVVFAVGEEMTAAYRRVAATAHNHFASLITEEQMAALVGTTGPAAVVSTEPEPPRLLFVGRLSPEKGISHLLGALVRLRDQGHVIQLDIVGSGRSAEELQAEVKALGLTEQVTFHGYVAHGEPLLAYYRRATAFVAPSLQGEGFPQVINEALAAGIPVIASAVGGIPAYLHHGTTGLLVPPGDRIALSEALTTILEDPVLRQRLARQGQALMRNNTLEANRDRIVAVVKREVFHELESAPSVGTL